MGSHKAKREDFSARLLPEADTFRLEEVGVESHWGFQGKPEVTRRLAKESVCVCCKSMGQADTWKNYGGS